MKVIELFRCVDDGVSVYPNETVAAGRQIDNARSVTPDAGLPHVTHVRASWGPEIQADPWETPGYFVPAGPAPPVKSRMPVGHTALGAPGLLDESSAVANAPDRREVSIQRSSIPITPELLLPATYHPVARVVPSVIGVL